MPPFPPTVDKLYRSFDDLPDFEDRIDYLIDLGRELPTPSVDLQTDQNLVAGCMSAVWLKINVDGPDSQVRIEADSDSQIIRGLLVILAAFYDRKTPLQIVRSDASEFLKRLELDQHLSPQRRNGLFAMVKRINGLALQIISQQEFEKQ